MRDPDESEPAMPRDGAGFRRCGPDGHQSHLIPAPRLKAMEARSMTAVVKRARFAFTMTPLLSVRAWSGGRAASVRQRPEIPGFASPPRGGFALDGHGAADVFVHAANVGRHQSGVTGPSVPEGPIGWTGAGRHHEARPE